MKRTLVVCESVAAITPHLREVTARYPVRLTGHLHPRPRALCGAEVAWDTKLPVVDGYGVHTVRCRDCLVAQRGAS